jgi:hypothetical protein
MFEAIRLGLFGMVSSLGLLNLNTGILQIAGYGSNSDTLNVKNNFSNFAPRLGVAYQVLPRTVVRAGYGIVYGQGWAGDTFGGMLTSSFPTQVQQTLTPESNAGGSLHPGPGAPGLYLPGNPSQRQLRIARRHLSDPPSYSGPVAHCSRMERHAAAGAEFQHVAADWICGQRSLPHVRVVSVL